MSRASINVNWRFSPGDLEILDSIVERLKFRNRSETVRYLIHSKYEELNHQKMMVLEVREKAYGRV